MALIVKEEINNADPYPDFIRTIIESDDSLVEMTAFNGSVYFGTEKYLIRFTDDTTYIVYSHKYGAGKTFYATDERLFFTDVPYSGSSYCHTIAYARLDDKVLLDCDFYQTCDKAGDTFIGVKLGDELHYLYHNESKSDVMTVPNSLNVFGITASENGDVWLMGYNLYVIPQGTPNAVRVLGSPHITGAMPMKARKQTKEVLIGADTGLYIGAAQ